MNKRVTAAQLNLHANGIPPAQCNQYARVARAAIKAGCTILQAVCIAKLAYNVASGFHWNVPGLATGLQIHCERTNSAAAQGGGQ